MNPLSASFRLEKANLLDILRAIIIGIIVSPIILFLVKTTHYGTHFVSHFTLKLASGDAFFQHVYLGIILVIASIPFFLVTEWCRESKGEGLGKTINFFKDKDSLKRPVWEYLKVIIAKITSTLITLVGGGSAGLEAPSALVAEESGSLTSKTLLKVKDPHKFKLFQVCSVAAGFTVLLHSPALGVLLACDMLAPGLKFEIKSAIFALASAGTAEVILRLTGNYNPFFNPSLDAINYSDYRLISGLILTAIFVFLICALYAFLLDKVEHKLDKTELVKNPRANRFLIILLGFSVVAVIGILNWQHPHSVFGIGEEIILEAFHGTLFSGNAVLLTGLLLVFPKIFAATFTLGARGSGGNLTPTLFIGAVGGAMIAQLFGYAAAPFLAIAIAVAFSTVLNIFFSTPFAIAIIFGPHYFTLGAMGVLVSFITRKIDILELEREREGSG